MIKFFRKIRYKLMNENKTGEYFKYAIGEILLVVVGILIALGINNWNEDRKAKQNEKVLLEKLKIENEFNLNTLIEDIDYRQQLAPLYYSFMDYLSGDNLGSTSDSLEYYMAETLRTTSYTFTQNSIVNFINAQKNYFSELNKEIALLENAQSDLNKISEKLIDLKIENYFKALENDVDFNSGEIYSTKTLTSTAFRNNLLLIAGVEEEISNKFFLTVKQMKKVDSLITTNLK